VLVKIDSDGKEVFGETSSGNPYPPMKACSEGEELTKEEFMQKRYNGLKQYTR
jgi:hypothetical protein